MLGAKGKFPSMEDLIIVREVAALRAHIASCRTMRQKLDNVAKNVNQNPNMTQKVTWKSVQGHYKRL
eukprot:IDg5615t1